MKKVYIAGAVRGINPEVVKSKFALAQSNLEASGYKPINPVKEIGEYNNLIVKSGGVALSDEKEADRKSIMKMCFGLLMDCEHIYLLHDWQQSEGAVMEKQLADMLKIPVLSI